MSVHCGFVRGIKPGRQTKLDLDDSDLLEMDRCRGIVVASAIFGSKLLYIHPRTSADCIVGVVEELWWKTLDFSALEWSSVSFFSMKKTRICCFKW